jgi:Flp pilus assembly protein TadD
LRKATQLEPEHKNHWLNLGVAYRKANDNDAAIAVYEKALRAHPNDPQLLNNLGVALRKARRYDDAIKAHERAVDADPYDPASARNLAIAYRGGGHYAKAIPIYIKAIELGDGGPPDLLFDLASCYEKTGNTELAIDTFEAYIRAVKKSDPAAAERAKRAVANLEKK